MIDLLCSQSGTDEHLEASIKAVGLARFARTTHDAQLTHKSRRDYLTAIRTTNVALRSPTDVTKDSTLFSVILLSTFEMIGGSSPDCFRAWAEHVQGAVALVKLRGRRQLSTDLGRRLFRQVASDMMITCVQNNIRMPACITELRYELLRHQTPTDTVWSLPHTILDYPNFQASISDGSLADRRAIVQAGLEMVRITRLLICTLRFYNT